MAAKKKEQSKLKGVTVNNSQVASFTRKHGAPTFSKPHGAEKTILYYPNPDYKADTGDGKFEDFAGKETPGAGRTTVIQKGRDGSKVSTRRLVGGGGAHASRGAENLGNPNREAEKAEIVNKGDLDKEILKIEEKERTPDEDNEAVIPRTPETTSDKVKKVAQDPVKTDVDSDKVTKAIEPEEKKDSSKKSK